MHDHEECAETGSGDDEDGKKWVEAVCEKHGYILARAMGDGGSGDLRDVGSGKAVVLEELIRFA